MQNPFAPLIAIARRGDAFTAFDGQTFVRLPLGSGGFYILPVRSPSYREWFYHEFFAAHDTLPTARAFHAILLHLEAEAHHGYGTQRLAVWRRVGSADHDRVLLDLSNTEGQYVEISPTAWTITAAPGVLLQTSRSTLPLPLPEPSLTPALDTLRSCLNLPRRADWLRCLAWLMAALRPSGPHPTLILQGPPGSGKSVAARILRAVVDPSTSPLTPTPSSVRDLLTLTRHNWILAFDHLSALSPLLADALCRLSSGLGASLRETADRSPEPLQQSYRRPVLLTVTERWTSPPGLAERALTLTFPPLESGLRTEESLLRVFYEARPAILAALCSAVSTALSRTPSVPLPARCPNALAWAMAASPALGCTDEEMRDAFGVPQPLHPLAEAVRNLLAQRRQWTGTATQLLDLLHPVVSCQTPKVLSQQLKTCMLTLADTGIELKFRRLTGGVRIIDLSDAPPEKDPPGASLSVDLFSQTNETGQLK